MIEELRTFPAEHGPADGRDRSAPASRRARARCPRGSSDADFLFAQVRFSLDELLEWRAQVEFDGPVYAGVMVVPSVTMARKIGADIQQLAVPDVVARRDRTRPDRRRRRSRATSWRPSASRARSTACTSSRSASTAK